MKVVKMFTNGIVPVDLLLVDQHGHRGGRERLGRRSDLKERILGHRVVLSDFLHAEALRIDDAVVLHDRHRHAGKAPGRHRVRRKFVERLLGNCGKRNEKKKQKSTHGGILDKCGDSFRSCLWWPSRAARRSTSGRYPTRSISARRNPITRSSPRRSGGSFYAMS